jgi:hypothetical protein
MEPMSPETGTCSVEQEVCAVDSDDQYSDSDTDSSSDNESCCGEESCDYCHRKNEELNFCRVEPVKQTKDFGDSTHKKDEKPQENKQLLENKNQVPEENKQLPEEKKVEKKKLVIPQTTSAELDVHSLRPLLTTKVKELGISKEKMDEKTFLEILEKWKDKIDAEHPLIDEAHQNIRNAFKDGKITDDHLEGDSDDEKGYNICYPMKLLVDEGNKACLTTTLLEIGKTCRQGITFRIIIMYSTMPSIAKPVKRHD